MGLILRYSNRFEYSLNYNDEKENIQVFYRSLEPADFLTFVIFFKILPSNLQLIQKTTLLFIHFYSEGIISIFYRKTRTFNVLQKDTSELLAKCKKSLKQVSWEDSFLLTYQRRRKKNTLIFLIKEKLTQPQRSKFSHMFIRSKRKSLGFFIWKALF